jgi:DNA replication protein DnaC
MNNNLNINLSPSIHNPFEDVLSNKNIIDLGFSFPLTLLTITKKNYLNFYKDINSKYNLSLFDFSDSNNDDFFILKNNSMLLNVSFDSSEDEYIIDGFFDSFELSSEFFSIYKKYISLSDEVFVHLNNFFISNGKLEKNNKKMKINDFDNISSSYYPYFKTDILFKQFLKLNENILLLTGKPGLGKSKLSTLLLKYSILNSTELPYPKEDKGDFLTTNFVNVAFVKNIDVLASDEFWQVLEKKAFDFVFLDDLDNFLSDRSGTIASNEDSLKNKFLSQLLSFTDGIKNHKTKFIITTNQSIKNIDTAVLRKGRLFGIFELRNLTNDEAKKIWVENNLDLDDFNSLFTSNSILSSDLGSEINKKLTFNSTESFDDFLLDPSVAILDKSMSKKMGF